MSEKILKAERTRPVEGMEGVVFRDARHGPVEVVQVVNEALPSGRWLVSMWVREAPTDKQAFLEGCEVNLDFILQGFAARPAACA